MRSKSRQLCNIYIPKEDINLDESFEGSEESDDDEIVVKKNDDDLVIDKFINNQINIKDTDLNLGISRNDIKFGKIMIIVLKIN